LIFEGFPSELINITPYIYYRYANHYWLEQINFVHSQYCDLSEDNLQTWLDSRRRMFDSIMEYAKMKYAKQRLAPFPRRRRSSLRLLPIIVFHPIRTPSPIPIIRNINNNDINNEIQGLENENSDKKRNNFIKAKKKKSKKEFYKHNNEFNMKGKKFNNKFTHKYG
jgi:hypothetical protein